MPSPIGRVPAARAIRRVDFRRTKYGRELSVDARFISKIPGFDRSDRPHVLSFYDVTLITRGRGTFALDDEVHRAAPGIVFFSRPGDVRRLRIDSLDGASLFFTDDFVQEAFADSRFLDEFAFFRSDRRAGALRLTASQRALFLSRFRRMDQEFPCLRGDASHLLRAVLYELLVLLNRWYTARFGEPVRRTRHPTVERYLRLVERTYSAERSVAELADELGVTPGHLGTLCRTHLGRSPGRILADRVMLEARRLLVHSDEPAASIAFALGFRDPAYFGRCFKKATGHPPRQFRQTRRA